MHIVLDLLRKNCVDLLAPREILIPRRLKRWSTSHYTMRSNLHPVIAVHPDDCHPLHPEWPV